jgi:hypothetical protein
MRNETDIHILNRSDQCYFSFEKGSGMQRVTKILSERGGVSYTSAMKKKGSRTLFQLASF